MEKSILIIDDDSMITRTMRDLLSREGYNTRTSGDGYEALDEIFGNTAFDLIVCDLRLPGMDGIETVRKIRQYLKDTSKPDIPVIFITGYTESELYTQAQQLGRVFAKPFDTADFLSSVEEYISA